MPKPKSKPEPNPLQEWLDISFDQPERAYNPNVQQFLAGVLGYPRKHVLTEGRAVTGFPDIQLLTPEGDPWVVGDFKLADAYLNNPQEAERLWQEKKKYVSGLTRYVLFLTPKRLQVRSASGQILKTLNLETISLQELREALADLSWDQAQHSNQWATLVKGQLPYSYLSLTPENTPKLQQDLHASFEELTEAAQKALDVLEQRYQEYQARRKDAQQTLVGAQPDTRRRALARIEGEYPMVLKALFEAHLPRFTDQYGREIEGKEEESNPRIREAFAADSAAALIARVLFLRFLEDLKLTRRRLTNGGPERWGAFVEFLTGSATALVKVSSMDLKGAYQEPFEEEMFAWVLEANGLMDQALQRLILRVNAYDFQGLSEEVLGEIYQNFLPPAKRKRLGEFYTPRSIVDYLLQETALNHPGDALPRVLDPACGSGSFLVRYFHRVVEGHRGRGLEVNLDALRESIWGFDLNPFASYISLFQLLWGQLRLKAETKPKVHVYNQNALVRDDVISQLIGDDHLSPGERARDQEKWDYVLGNPPYIRAERVKYGAEMQTLYQEVWSTNGDTGLIFLWRSLREWLKEGGKLGMVVSGGYASSEAAAPVWSLLWPGKGYALRKVVWLEFIEENGRQQNLWDAARIPMALIIEKTAAKPDDLIELWVPSSWPKDSADPYEVSRIVYKDFFDARVNPVVQAPHNNVTYGAYLLPLLKAEDVGLLQKLHPGKGAIVPLTEAMETQYTRQKPPKPYWWTYGVTRAGAEVTSNGQGRPVISGASLGIAHEPNPVGYVDLDQCRSKSLWGEKDPGTYLAVANITLSPFAAVIRKKPAAVDSLIVGVPKEGLGEAVAAYLNSALVRWYWAVHLRSGVIQGYYAHIYPRTLESLPWPKAPDAQILQKLTDLYKQLEGLAATSREHPFTWFSKAVEERKSGGSGYTLASKKLGLDFRGWQQACGVEQIGRDGSRLQGDGLFAQIDLKDEELARYVELLLQGLDEGTSVDSKTLQQLWVAQDYSALLHRYDQKEAAFAEARQKFQQTLKAIDEAVFDLFGLNDNERLHIKERLQSFPLNKLQPRYPWEVGEARLPRSYTVDRFA